MYKVIYVGGPADGKREAVLKLENYRFCVVPKPFIAKMGTGPIDPSETLTEKHEYVLQYFCDQPFYCVRKMSCQEIVRRLLDGYYPESP